MEECQIVVRILPPSLPSPSILSMQRHAAAGLWMGVVDLEEQLLGTGNKAWDRLGALGLGINACSTDSAKSQ